MLFVSTYNLFSGFPKTNGELSGWQTMFYKAWGVHKATANRIVNSYYENGFVIERKSRNDKGLTLINSERKRKSVYSPLYVYKREQTHKKFRTHTQRLCAINFKEEFDSIVEDEETVYSKIADNFVKQGNSLHHNIIDAVAKTSGNISYK